MRLCIVRTPYLQESPPRVLVNFQPSEYLESYSHQGVSEVEEVEEGCCEPACGLWVKPVNDDEEETREGWRTWEMRRSVAVSSGF